MGARGNSDEEEEYAEEEEEEEAQGQEVEGQHDDDEDEEDDEGQDEYEKDDFIVDEVEEEPVEDEQGSDEEAKAKRKKRKKREAEELDEEDYELLDEAGSAYHRPSKSDKKFKRLKKAGKTDDMMLTLSDNEEAEAGPVGDAGDEDRIEEDDIPDDDEMADFIVDEDDVDENGLRSRRPKKKKQAREASSDAIREAQSIFGDPSSIIDERRIRSQRQDDEDDGRGRSRLEKEFEPGVLEEKYMTDYDDRIRDMDIPERLQLMLEAVGGPVSPSETVAREAEWLYDRAFGRLAVPARAEFQHVANVEKADIMKQIANFIHLVHDQKLEVPFIGMYRKEACKDLIHEEPENADFSLKHYKALWAVYYWDKKWWLLQRRRAALRGAFEKRARADAQKRDVADFLDKLLLSLADAPSELSVDDIEAKFNLHFPPDEIEDGQFKRPKRRSFYSTCRRHGLAEVSRHFGLSPEQFGENLQVMYKRYEVENAAATPDEIAASHFSGEFSDVISVLRGARHMAAVEISAEPAVREYVRNMYMERAVVSTKPTLEGNRVIEAFHQYADVKWLLNKPVNAFTDSQWLLIEKAEAEKLLEVSIGIPKDVAGSLVQEFETLYLSDGVSRTAQLWNEQRKQILKDALSSFLLPSMEKEARVIMTARAKQWISLQYADQLWKRVSVAPYPRPSVEQEDRPEEEAPRVLACCWGPGNPATAFVMLDSSGEIIDTLHTGYLALRTTTFEQEQRKKSDQQRLLQFMKEHQPHVVVLGAANLNCRYLRDVIFEVIFKIVEVHPRDLADGLDMIQMVYGDETIPSLYETSRVSEEQLQQQSGIVRRAVALGRYLQNPLAVVSSLFGPSKDILSLKLHPLQEFLSPDERYESLETVMVTVTNQVGVDINMAASHDWQFAPLQFVAGLGPRKAASIRRTIQGAGRVNLRKEMLTSLELLRRCVFINAAGFIRVRGSGQAATGNQVLDPLDDTRIHPESYELAKKMAEDAYCEEFPQKADEMDEDTLEMAIEHVRERPRVLRNLDVEEYAKVVLERGMVTSKKLETLQDIKQELQHGFQECRAKYRPPDTDEVFYMLTGETEESLCEGRVVQATVRKVQQNKVLCSLESGLLGFIQKEDLSDDRDVDPTSKVTEGGVLACRIKQVQKAKFFLELTSKGSDLRAEHWSDRRTRDPYYSYNPAFFQEEEAKSRKKVEEEKQRAFKKRMIVHPRFQNISLAEATQFLEDKEPGSVVIRPSSKGPSHLSMTLKFYDGVYTHVEIVEGGKDVRSMTSLLRLGKTLTIGEDTFEDLDEVNDRYVDPLVSNWRKMFSYRKFRPGAREEIDSILSAEKQANPARIPYYMSVCYEHPGVFTLSYIRSVNVHHEYISVSPKGFRFRQKFFDSPDKLVAYFQRHFNDPVPTAPPRRAAASMVPPAWTDGSDPSWRGGGNRGSWDSRPPSRREDPSAYRGGWDQRPADPSPWSGWGGGGSNGASSAGWAGSDAKAGASWGDRSSGYAGAPPPPPPPSGW